MEASDVGSSIRPAWSVEQPRTSCRYWEKKYSRPAREKIASTVAMIAQVKAGRLNSSTSISGVVSVRWRRRKTHPAPRPASRAATAMTVRPLWAKDLTA